MLGIAFQVQDDVLGVWGDEALTGKPVADDIRSRKKSFPIVWAFEHAPTSAREELDRIYTGEMDETAVSRAVALLEESGARTAATDTAERWLEDAFAPARRPRSQSNPAATTSRPWPVSSWIVPRRGARLCARMRGVTYNASSSPRCGL